MLASVKLGFPQRLANRTGNTGSPRKLRQLPRNGIVAIDTGFGPITIGSRKSKSTGCQASGRGALGGVRRVMLLNFDARFTSESGTNERSQTVVIDGLPLY
jgi:hypothetical protein